MENILTAEPGTSLWSVATGIVKPWFKKSRQAVDFITAQDGFVAVHPDVRGTLWLFESKNDAIRAKNAMEAKGILCGNHICKFTVAEDGAIEFDDEIPEGWKPDGR